MCRIICRARLVPFVHPLEYNLQATATIANLFEMAPAAGPEMIKIGYNIANLQPEGLEDMQAHVREMLPGLDSRGVMEYTLLLASALMVRQLSYVTVCIVSDT